jgi:hypothetical protein
MPLDASEPRENCRGTRRMRPEVIVCFAPGVLKIDVCLWLLKCPSAHRWSLDLPGRLRCCRVCHASEQWGTFLLEKTHKNRILASHSLQERSISWWLLVCPDAGLGPHAHSAAVVWGTPINVVAFGVVFSRTAVVVESAAMSSR